MVHHISLRTNTFFTPVNLFNILHAFSWIAVAAFGEMLMLIARAMPTSSMISRSSNLPRALPMPARDGLVVGQQHARFVHSRDYRWIPQ